MKIRGLQVFEDTFNKVAGTGKMVLAAGLVGLTLVTAGCLPTEVATNAHVQYDMLDTQDEKLVTEGIQQILNIPRENFRLVVDYKVDLEEAERWTVTSNKSITIEVHTLGLDPDTKVYVDNVHIDTTIMSYYPTVDGITQDSMDDRIHNSHMIGFPISDTNYYNNVNNIEGQNDTFIHGSFTGFQGYNSGSISEKRYLESDYLNYGVYANKISSVIDLIIEKPDGTTTCVSVPSTIAVSVWPYIKMEKSDGEITYRYYHLNRSTGKVEYDTLSQAEYEARTAKNTQYHK